MKNKKIVIAGGTGFIGQVLAEYFYRDNNIVILTRGLQHSVNNNFGTVLLNEEAKQHIQFVQWNDKDAGEWYTEIDGADIVINLAGKSVNCRYTKKNKQEIFDSRTNATKAIGDAIHAATVPPKLWLNAASATIYRYATDRPQDEYSGDIEDDFSVQVCKRWEKVFFEQRTPFTRKVALRMAVTLGSGGVMMPYLNLCRFALGGRQGSGNQMYSWVHAEDVCRAVEFIYAHTDIEGAYNVCSPQPVTNSTFMQTLRKVTHHAIGLPAYTWMFRIGAALIGTETELLLKSRWVVPTKLQEAGFAFKYTVLEDAFTNIVQQLPRKKYHLF
jgi:uncharacterized protein (TIGR01777 family)